MTIDVIEKNRMVLSDVDANWLCDYAEAVTDCGLSVSPYRPEVSGTWEFLAQYAANESFADLLALISRTYPANDRFFCLGLTDLEYYDYINSGFFVHNLTAFFDLSEYTYYIGLDFQHVPLNELNKFFMDIMEFLDREDIPARVSLICEYVDTISIDLHFTTGFDFYEFFAWLVECSRYCFRVNFKYR